MTGHRRRRRWTAVLPTLTRLQLVLARALAHLPEILRPVVVATLAVPIVVYVLVPRLQRVAARLARRTNEKAAVMST